MRENWHKRFKKFIFWFLYKVYISALVFGHCTLAIDDLLHPTGHAGDQVLEEGALLGALNPHLQDGLFPLLQVGAVVVLHLLLHPRPDCLDRVEVGRVPRPIHKLDVGPLLLAWKMRKILFYRNRCQTAISPAAAAGTSPVVEKAGATPAAAAAQATAPPA